MSSLREKFISFLQLRGFTKATVRNYLQAMKQFQDWLGKSPIHMNQEDARRYLSYLKNVKRLAPRTMNIHLYVSAGTSKPATNGHFLEPKTRHFLDK